MKITANSTLQPFKPSAEMITAAENLYLAIAHERTVRQIVEECQRKVLRERVWEVEVIYETSGKIVEHVTDIKLAWLMKPDDFDVYLERCNEEWAAASLKQAIDAGQPLDDQCPLLVAADRLRLAKTDLIDSMAGVTNINGDLAASMTLPDYDRLIDLTLNLLAPFVSSPVRSK